MIQSLAQKGIENKAYVLHPYKTNFNHFLFDAYPKE